MNYQSSYPHNLAWASCHIHREKSPTALWNWEFLLLLVQALPVYVRGRKYKFNSMKNIELSWVDTHIKAFKRGDTSPRTGGPSQQAITNTGNNIFGITIALFFFLFAQCWRQAWILSGWVDAAVLLYKWNCCLFPWEAVLMGHGEHTRHTDWSGRK